MANAQDLKSWNPKSRAGSSPATGTMLILINSRMGTPAGIRLVARSEDGYIAALYDNMDQLAGTPENMLEVPVVNRTV